VSQNYIFDSNTKKPINAVHIYYNQNKGLVTNNDGYFELPNNVFIDSLHFSHLSYESKIIKVSDFKKNDTLFFDNSTIELNEIVFNTINAKEIVTKAINMIDENYLNAPHNLFGFFRQSLKENEKGIEMIEVEFINYTENKNVSTKIIKARRTENFSKWGLETYGGVFDMVENGDFVRRKAFFLDSEKTNNYQFIYEGKIKQGDLKIFKISFHPIDDNDLESLRKGTLYIDSESYAIVEIEYTFDKVKLSKITTQTDKNIPAKKPFYWLNDVKTVIKYKQLSNKKWGLFYLDSYNLIKGTYNGDIYNYNFSAKLIINNVKTLKAVKVKTNYNLSKDFNKAVKKYKKLKNWNDTYKFSLSSEEKQILKDINDIANK